MKLAMIGLGKMGANMALRLMRGGHAVHAYDMDGAALKALAGDGAVPAESLDELVSSLDSPRVIWLMLPSGAPTEATVSSLAPPKARSTPASNQGSAARGCIPAGTVNRGTAPSRHRCPSCPPLLTAQAGIERPRHASSSSAASQVLPE